MLALMYWVMTFILRDRGILVMLGYAYVPGGTLGSSAWLQHVPRPGIGQGQGICQFVGVTAGRVG